ncbi:MAG: aminoglycoside phosphotransferase, partial [Bacteroidota bacterium]
MEYLLKGEDLEGISQFLRTRQWIGPDEKLLSARKPGEGNMNYTLRIRSDFRTFILKQSRDYVEKYPSIPAPAHRAIVEGSFYEVIQRHPDLR